MSLEVPILCFDGSEGTTSCFKYQNVCYYHEVSVSNLALGFTSKKDGIGSIQFVFNLLPHAKTDNFAGGNMVKKPCVFFFGIHYLRFIRNQHST